MFMSTIKRILRRECHIPQGMWKGVTEEGAAMPFMVSFQKLASYALCISRPA